MGDQNETRRVPDRTGTLFEELIEIMARLREPDGCPWDREQTPSTLRPYALEEAAELVEAIEGGDDDEVAEELGDLLLQVVFHARIAQEEGRYDVRTVLRGITEKLRRRHPHVFQGLQVEDSREVLVNWERIKGQEKGKRRSVLEGVPRILPPLLRAYRVQERAARVGFDWDNPAPALAKVREELEEVIQADREGEPQAVQAELGDLLFAVVNLCRHLGVRPEDALAGTTDRFAARFRGVEERVKERGEQMDRLSLAELDRHWEAVKKQEP